MNSVDFLPNDYRRRAADRRLHALLLAVLAVYAALVIAITAYQLLTQRSVKQKFEQLGLPTVQAELANKRVAELEVQLAEINVHADLHTYLRHPWPRTQILAALVDHLPSEVSLTEVTMRRERRERQEERAILRRPKPSRKEDKKDPKKPDAQESLKRLRKETDATRTLIWIRGMTTDNSALHKCIRDLGDSWLFTRADLESLDSTENENTPGAASFEICLELLPGYGQPDGPDEAPPESIAS